MTSKQIETSVELKIKMDKLMILLVLCVSFTVGSVSLIEYVYCVTHKKAFISCQTCNLMKALIPLIPKLEQLL